MKNSIQKLKFQILILDIFALMANKRCKIAKDSKEFLYLSDLYCK
jgi:spore coat polysaccharide biosynthesis predicted glycosyltransferase SpsG